MTKDELSWIMMIFSVASVILNGYKNKWCFVLWLGTNGFWAIYFWSYGLYAPAVQQVIFFGLAVWGLWRWAREEKKC